jgi:signal transduction histidine kinase/DNA-binding response OmpR family regulator
MLEDNPADADLIRFELEEAGIVFESKVIMTEKDFIRELKDFSPDIILSDYDLPGYNGALALAEAKRRSPDIPFILVTGAVQEERAIEVLISGARDYVMKSRLNRLVPALRRANAEAEERSARKAAEMELRESHKRLECLVEERTASLQRELTERKQAEEQLRLLSDRYELAVKSAGIGVWDWDIKKHHLIWDNQMYVLYGVSKADFSNAYEAWRKGIHPDDAVRVNVESEEVHASGNENNIEFRIVWPNGQIRYLRSVGRFIRDDHGDAVRMIGINYDITGIKQAEAEQEKLHAQLNQAQKMESVGRLAGGVAHDFNNMLAVILGHTEMALDMVNPEQPLFNALTEIRKAAERSANLTQQLLAFARKQTIVPRILDLNLTVEGMLKMLRRLIGEDIDLVWLPGACLEPVKIDPGQIDQMLANLCVNARDAIDGVGTITIKTDNVVFNLEDCAGHTGFAPGEYVSLIVSDSGCGMTEETLAHLFEPFFTTKIMGKGTGLGLATVYGIVKQNNGLINACSTPGRGTTFNIYLPRHVGRADELRTTDRTEEAACGSETVLLVEDEPGILNMSKIMMEGLGYRVIAAATPGEAIRLAAKHAGEIHLLMTDMVMPEMNGHDLAKNLLSDYPQIRRLFMSGYAADVNADTGVLDGGAYFIQKPFTKKDLASMLRKVLDSK